MADKNIGKIAQIIGAVLDIKFAEGSLPEINDAIRITRENGEVLTVEVSQHLGDDTVRCIAMGPTDGLVRGMDAEATGAPITVPAGIGRAGCGRVGGAIAAARRENTGRDFDGGRIGGGFERAMSYAIFGDDARRHAGAGDSGRGIGGAAEILPACGN